MSSKKNLMDMKSAARIQSFEARANSGGALKGEFASRAQRAAARNASLGAAAGNGGGGGASGRRGCGQGILNCCCCLKSARSGSRESGRRGARGTGGGIRGCCCSCCKMSPKITLLTILILLATIIAWKYIPWETVRKNVILFYHRAATFVAEGGIGKTCKKAEDLLKKAPKIVFEKVEDLLKAMKNLLPEVHF